MFGKLGYIFVWFLEDSWSAWRSQTFFWSCRSFRMSGKLVNIFVWFLTNSWSAWTSQRFFWNCRSFRMSGKVVNIFVWFLTNFWSAWRSQTIFLKLYNPQDVCKASKYFSKIFKRLLEWLEILDNFCEVVEAPVYL